MTEQTIVYVVLTSRDEFVAAFSESWRAEVFIDNHNYSRIVPWPLDVDVDYQFDSPQDADLTD